MKMYLSVSVLLNLLFYFNFVNSCENYKIYKSWLHLLEDENTLVARNSLKYHQKICDTNPVEKFTWATICKNVVHRMRKVKNGDYDNVLADYLAFEKNEKCSFIDVSVPGWTRKAHQPVLFCYVRQAIIPLDGSIEPPPYKKVAVFPRGIEDIMVFKYNPLTEVYSLVHIFKNFAWTRFLPIPPKVFDIQVPNSYSKINEMYNKLHDSVRGLETNSENTGIIFAGSQTGYFQLLCEVTYRSGKYRKLSVTRISKCPKGVRKYVWLLSTIEGKPDIRFRVTLYSCAMNDNTSSKWKRQYYLATGPNENSVILVQKKEDGEFMVIEYIENLHYKYLNFFRHY